MLTAMVKKVGLGLGLGLDLSQPQPIKTTVARY
jgi:hypothetical protein